MSTTSRAGIEPIPTHAGIIGRTVDESEASFPARPHPGATSPNVVIVLLDDVGFAQFGCYGSDIDTGNIDSLAADGLQFTNFHVTPLCSPTRASLLTGRSQHAVGMRSVSNFQTGFPHQRGHISNHAGTIAEVLHAEGYVTFCAGKWHLAPTDETSSAGPFDQWPLARGFDRYYGFLEGETDQFHPEVVIDNHRSDPSSEHDDDYHLSEDLVDQLLLMINDSRSIRPDRPFFAYLPFGAAHSPHQAPASYLEKYRGRYDEGWDVVRQRWFERQAQLGVVAADTQLAPRNPGVEPWDALPEDHQRFAARLQEAFAAFLDHTDDQIGRFVRELDAMGELDNTILVVMADNGASQEGGPTGVMHEMKWFAGLGENPSEAVARLDEIGGPRSHTNYPWGWAQCGNSPFRWYKQNTHEGGVHVPMIMHWPSGISPDHRGSMRRQFVNVSDVAPTIYEMLGIEPPTVLKGREQLPITGQSFRSLLEDPEAPATNRMQYFENGGSRALIAAIRDSWWKVVTRHVNGTPFEDDDWELYDLGSDPSECTNRAGDEPALVEELVAMWWVEAERNGVLPLDDRGLLQIGRRRGDESPHRPDRRYRYRPPLSPIPNAAGPNLGGRGWDLRADMSRRSEDEGVLFATGNGNAGFSVFVLGGRLVVDYNAFDDHTILESSRLIPPGRSNVTVGLRRTEGRSGVITAAIDGEEAGRVAVPLVMSVLGAIGSSVGYDEGHAVSDRYAAPFAFEGELHEVEIELVGSVSPSAAEAQARAEMAKQ